MEIISTQFKHCDAVKINGRLDSATSPRLAEELQKIQETDRFKIVIDMSGLEFVSSAGLRVLISNLKTCKRYNRGDLVLAGLPSKILSVFDLAGFTALFRIYNDVLTAVGSF
jgi:anti-sigma B factor antagonist